MIFACRGRRFAAPGRFARLVSSFRELGISESLCNAVEAMDIDQQRPTPVQREMIPMLLRGGSAVGTAPTGTGKTLTYLLPVVQAIREAEMVATASEYAGVISTARPEDGRSNVANGSETPAVIKTKSVDEDEEEQEEKRRPGRPAALILAPSRELASQVLKTAKALSFHTPFRSALLSGAGKLKREKDALSMPQDVVVATPGRLLEHVDAGRVFLSSVRHVVIDEADTMLDPSGGFGPEVERILERCGAWVAGGPPRADDRTDDRRVVESMESSRELPQRILVGATMPETSEEQVRKLFPDIAHIRVAGGFPPLLKQEFVHVRTWGNDKWNETIRLIQEEFSTVNPEGKVIVFCNSVASCRFLHKTLQEQGYVASCLHGDMPRSDRLPNLQAFREGQPVGGAGVRGAAAGGARQQGRTGRRYPGAAVLVATDLAMRGLDIPEVGHVILFDFPRSVADYIHRVGRTARAGQPGRATSLITSKDARRVKAVHRAAEAAATATSGERGGRRGQRRGGHAAGPPMSGGRRERRDGGGGRQRRTGRRSRW